MVGHPGGIKPPTRAPDIWPLQAPLRVFHMADRPGSVYNLLHWTVPQPENTPKIRSRNNNLHQGHRAEKDQETCLSTLHSL
jgi:hypothetical protein